jgi:small subunit ribosomal protein S9
VIVAKSVANEFTATGRRKTAVARVRMALGVGKTSINGKTMEEYFPNDAMRRYIEQPLVATDSLKGYDISANIRGGGPQGQAGALRHGLARALVVADPALKEVLKNGGYLTRDSRMKERKKTGQPGARKKFQFSKR